MALVCYYILCNQLVPQFSTQILDPSNATEHLYTLCSYAPHIVKAFKNFFLLNFTMFWNCLKRSHKLLSFLYEKWWLSAIPPKSTILTKTTYFKPKWTEKTQRHMVLEILVLALDRHKNVAGLNWLMGFSFPLFPSLHPSSASSPCYVLAFSSLK